MVRTCNRPHHLRRRPGERGECLLTKLRSTGMPIRRIREYAELMRGGDDTHEARLVPLYYRERLVER
jgi:hypothetical protein